MRDQLSRGAKPLAAVKEAAMHRPFVGGRHLRDGICMPEGVQYTCRSGQHSLLLQLRNPSKREVESVQRGEAEFALMVHRSVIFLLYRFADGLGWGDAPYSFHDLRPAVVRDMVRAGASERLAMSFSPRELPELPQPLATSETRTRLFVILKDAKRGVPRALRTVSFSPEFSRELHTTIVAQAAAPWSRESHDADLAEAYRRWPTSAAMLDAAIARTKAGE